MRAMVLPTFGGPENFEEREVEMPSAGPGELLVQIVATSVNPVDAKIRAGGAWAGISTPAILGYDAAGIITAVGPGVTSFHVGDEVFYTPEIVGNQHGTYAEFEAVPATIVAPKPPSLTFIEAAAVPLAGGTAWEAVVRRLTVRPGETVLIHGGAGGVGSFAVQFAKASGARVLATAGPTNQETLHTLGADVAIDYRQDDFVAVALRETSGAGVDAVFDTVGGDAIARSLGATRRFGRLATILAASGNFHEATARNQLIAGIFLTRERARLEEMTPLLERKQVRPLIDTVLPLDSVAEAHRRVDSGHGRGKIVLTV